MGVVGQGSTQQVQAAGAVSTPQPPPGELTDELINTSFWTAQMMAAAGIPVYDVPIEPGADGTVMTRAKSPDGKSADAPGSALIVHFGRTWLVTRLWVNGPMRVFVVRWRFRGGRIL